MQGLSGPEMIDLMRERGVSFETDFPEADRLGVIYQRRARHALIDQETWDRIPAPRRPESRLVIRTLIEEVPVRQFLEAQDRVEFLLETPDAGNLSGNDLVEAVRAIAEPLVRNGEAEEVVLERVRSELSGIGDQRLIALTVNSAVSARNENSLPKVAGSFD
jgi:hypothetical protein